MVSHIDAAMTNALLRQHVPGASLAIVQNGKVVYAKGYGVRDITSGARADAETIYPVGSNTKQFTAAAIMLLQERGRLSIHDYVAKYLPDAPHAKEITVQELLEQTSGLPNYTDTHEFNQHSAVAATPEHMLATIRNAPLAFSPGTSWQYSNTNYLLLSLIIAEASGVPYQRFVLQNLLIPLNLSRAAFDSSVTTYPDEAHGYTSFAMGQLGEAQHIDYSWSQGAGDLMMSAPDLARWDIALDAGKLVSLTSFEEMSTPKTLPDGTMTGYGYGLSAGKRFLGHLMVGHLGGLPGFVSEDGTFPSERFAIVLLANSDTFNPVPVVHDIIATIYGQPLPHTAVNALPETPDEEAQARLWLRRALSGNIDNSAVTPDFIAWVMATRADRDALIANLRTLGDRLGTPGALRLISRDGPPGLRAFDYYVTFPHDLIEFKFALAPSGKLDYLNFAPVYDY
jgi:D-alanyl-D-alanine carboxypeptidase